MDPPDSSSGVCRRPEHQGGTSPKPFSSWNRLPPPPPKPPKEPPAPAAASKADQARSSALPGTNWGSFKAAAAPPAPPPPPPGKAGRNVSSLAWGAPPPPSEPPPAPVKKPPVPPATSTAEQQRSHAFGTPRQYETATMPTTFGNSWHPGTELPPPAAPREEKKKKKAEESTQPNPATKLEQQVSHVLGGTPQGAADNRHRCSKSLMKVEFHGLPADADTPRLHRSLSALPYDQGVTCDIRKVHVKYDALSGHAAGTGSAQFRNVPDRDRVLAALQTGRDKGWLKAGSFKVVYDDTKRAL